MKSIAESAGYAVALLAFILIASIAVLAIAFTWHCIGLLS